MPSINYESNEKQEVSAASEQEKSVLELEVALNKAKDDAEKHLLRRQHAAQEHNKPFDEMIDMLHKSKQTALSDYNKRRGAAIAKLVDSCQSASRACSELGVTFEYGGMIK